MEEEEEDIAVVKGFMPYSAGSRKNHAVAGVTMEEKNIWRQQKSLHSYSQTARQSRYSVTISIQDRSAEWGLAAGGVTTADDTSSSKDGISLRVEVASPLRARVWINIIRK